jgi:hypothetical protein
MKSRKQRGEDSKKKTNTESTEEYVGLKSEFSCPEGPKDSFGGSLRERDAFGINGDYVIRIT